MAKPRRNQTKVEDERITFESAPYMVLEMVFQAVVDNRLDTTLGEMSEEAERELGYAEDELEDFDGPMICSDEKTLVDEWVRVENSVQDWEDAWEWLSLFDGGDAEVKLRDCDVLRGASHVWLDEQRQKMALVLAASSG